MNHASFLAEIIERPEDDTPRLIYADWLEDNGDPHRAEFIRVQCTLARQEYPEPALLKRQAALLDDHGAEWIAELPALDGVTWREFQRGFIDGVSVDSAEAFFMHGPTIAEVIPLRRLRVGMLDADSVNLLEQSPQTGRIEELALGGVIVPEVTFRELVRLPNLDRLTSLILVYAHGGNDLAESLRHCSRPWRLRELWLPGTHLDQRGIIFLAQSLCLGQLRILDLRDNEVTDQGLGTLSETSSFVPLEVMTLTNSRVTEVGVHWLVAPARWPSLARLHLAHNDLRDRGVMDLVQGEQASRWRELDLRHCRFAEAGADALASAQHLTQLRRLWVGGNQISTPMMNRLRARFGNVLVG